MDITEYLSRIEEMNGMGIPSHSTAMNHDDWDGPDNESQLRKDEDYAYYKKAYAFVDKDKNDTKKNAYRFIHHMVDEDGKIGAANVKACQTGIGVLNGARGGTTIPADNKKSVYNHLARHLRDADVEPAPMKEEADDQLVNLVNSDVVRNITEYIEMYVDEEKIDRESGIIKDVIILSGTSLNKRTYPSNVLKESVVLFEGIRVFMDHPESDTTSRSVKDLVGQFKDVYYDGADNKVKGNFYVLKSFQEWMFSIAESMPDIAGMSINGAGSVKKTQTGEIVEKLVSMKSVDLVVQPATTKGLFEEKKEEKKEQNKGDVDDMVDVNITLEMLKAEHNDVLKQYEKEVMEGIEISELRENYAASQKTISELKEKYDASKKTITDLTAEAGEKSDADAKAYEAKEKELNETVTTLKLKVEEFEIKEKLAQKKELVERLITEAGLPEKAVSPLLKELLLVVESEEKMRAILEDRKAFVASVSEGVVGLGNAKNLDEELNLVEKKEEKVVENKEKSSVGAAVASAFGLTEEEMN